MMRQVKTLNVDLLSIYCIERDGESVGQDIVDWESDEFGGAALKEGHGQTESNALIGDCNPFTEFKEGR